MRDILFKGKSKATGEWIYGWFVGAVNDFMFSPAHESAQIIDGDMYWHEVIPESVGQYTGFLDADGNKIFEGDIIEYNGSRRIIGEYVVEWWDGYYVAVIPGPLWQETFMVMSLFWREPAENDDLILIPDVKITGNIHDTFGPYAPGSEVHND